LCSVSHSSSGYSRGLIGEEQREQSREQDRHGRELADVYGRPAPATGVLSEHGGVVISWSIGVELGDDDIPELSNQQQRGGQAQRRDECSGIHDHAPPLIHRRRRGRSFCRAWKSSLGSASTPSFDHRHAPGTLRHAAGCTPRRAADMEVAGIIPPSSSA
jgi:hypothetical protein